MSLGASSLSHALISSKHTIAWYFDATHKCNFKIEKETSLIYTRGLAIWLNRMQGQTIVENVAISPLCSVIDLAFILFIKLPSFETLKRNRKSLWLDEWLIQCALKAGWVYFNNVCTKMYVVGNLKALTKWVGKINLLHRHKIRMLFWDCVDLGGKQLYVNEVIKILSGSHVLSIITISIKWKTALLSVQSSPVL